MIITKEQQESLVEKYIREKHNQDECIGFIDGINAALELIKKIESIKYFPDIDIDKAEELAWKTDYACFAVEEDGNVINKADAGAFFLEGYYYAKSLFKL